MTPKEKINAAQAASQQGESEKALSLLAQAFPCLKPLVGDPQSGLDPFDAHQLAEAVRGKGESAVHVVEFVLSLYDPYAMRTGAYPSLERFDVLDALGDWDTEDREVFIAWATDLFLP